MGKLILVAFVVLGTVFCTPAVAQTTMSIEVVRIENKPNCTIGDMGVDNASLGVKTLELAWRNNAANISRIPAGTYTTILRYDHDDKWRLELNGVPGHNHIQIHVGNWPSDTEGCILVGLTANACSVQNSAEAYKKLKRAFYGSESPQATPNKTVIVTVTDAR